MSYGSLSPRAVEAINRGAALAGCLQNTGEGGIAPTHQHGGELIWQIGTGYFGCRDEDGRFSLERLRERVAEAPVRAIEIKLSQGAKPGLGGLLPAAKITAEIAAHPRHPDRPRLRQPGRAHRVLRRRRAARLHRADRRRDRPAGRHQVRGRRPRLLARRSPSGWRRPAAGPTSSPSTAARAAPAPRRWCSAITSRCRSSSASRGLPAVRRAGRRRGRRVHRLGQARLPRGRAARARARLRHDQRRPRGDARDRLHPGPALPHRPLPDRASRRRTAG